MAISGTIQTASPEEFQLLVRAAGLDAKAAEHKRLSAHHRRLAVAAREELARVQEQAAARGFSLTVTSEGDHPHG